jgi:hypothetical protein
VADASFLKTNGGGGLYWLQSQSSPGTSLPAAFALSGTALPDSYTLTQSWAESGGLYAILAALPSDFGVFAGRLAAFQAQMAGQAIRFVWIANPDQPMAQWLTVSLAVAGSAVAAPSTLALGNYALFLGAGCGLGVAGDSLTIAAAGGLAQSQRFTAAGGAVSHPCRNVALLFTDAQAGCLQFTVTIPANAGDPDRPMADLGIGLRYYTDDPDYPGSDRLRGLRYPVLLPTADLDLWGSLDPSRPGDTGHSYLAFQAPGAGIGAAIPSTWRTALGHPVSLAAVGDAGGPGARLVFAPDPAGRTPVRAPDYALTFEGTWQMEINAGSSLSAQAATLAAEPQQRLMPGMAATEYLGLMSSSGSSLIFQSGNPALADLSAGAPDSLVSLGGWVTTSWLFAAGPNSNTIQYYAQPDQSEFFHRDPGGGGVSMGRMAAGTGRQAVAGSTATELLFLEVPALVLPDPQPGYAFPAVPYAGLEEADLGLFKAIELSVLSPRRRAILRGLPPGLDRPGPTLFEVTGTDPVGVTPQGLKGTFSPDLTSWEALTLTRTVRTMATNPLQLAPQDLVIAKPSGELKAAFQSNQMFLVLSDAATVQTRMSATYRFTSGTFGEFCLSKDVAGNPVPPEVVTALTNARINTTYYADQASYLAALAAALSPAQLSDWQDNLLFWGAFSDVTIDGWLFRLAPCCWNWSAASPTIAVFKYAGRSLSDLVNDRTAWAWIGGAGGPVGALATQKRLRAIIDDARTALSKGATDFADFVALADDPAWNGILYFNVAVPITALPGPLQGLAAGVDASRFYAHHIGININPIDTSATSVDIANGTLFGLIHYEDKVDIPFEDSDYDFKVLTLSVVFSNSKIASFASSIEVQINSLFGETSTLYYGDYGNNIVLAGSYQQHGEQGSYVFTQSVENVFEMDSFVLDQVDMLQVNFLTAVPADPASGSDLVQSRFVMTGILKFRAIEGFDAFSYGDEVGSSGGLRFDNLILGMDFHQSNPGGTRVFTFQADQLGVNLAASAARPGSLVNHFPLAFKSFLQGSAGKTPADLGYMSVVSPIPQGRMEMPWWGLTFQLELGSLGALAASAGLTATLVVAWSVAGLESNIYIGLKMPGSVGAQTRIPIEGILNLNFQKIELLVAGKSTQLALPAEAVAAEGGVAVAPAPETQYMMKFRGVSFSLLTLSFPPGTIDIYLFGNPDTGDSSLLGWYAAYVKSE